uniref:Uncharacterized protein n=1 Tax=Globisporangium ultimum (strain ATCC 200006 / CBS 805.95 / DAOM BR144) TaxID=431595 RepID=K3WUB9_GLOUD
MSLTQYYHTRDPIENLRIHVTLRKAAAANDEENDEAPTEAPNEEDTNMSAVFCSYIDADNYVPTEQLGKHSLLSERSTLPCHLATARSSRLPREHAFAVPWTTNAERAWVRSHREETFRSMHLVANLGSNSTSTTRNHAASEAVLCSLRFYPESGLLCVTPGFSVPIDVDEDPDAFTKGPKLSTYKTVVDGAEFEFSLDNVNDLMPSVSSADQQLLRELQILEERQDAAQVAKYNRMHSLTSSNFADDEAEKVLVLQRKLVLVEIVSVQDLDADCPVFAELNLRFPQNKASQHVHRGGAKWKLISPSAFATHQSTSQAKTRIRTSLSNLKSTFHGGTIAAFGFHTKFNLKLRKSKETPEETVTRKGEHALKGEDEESTSLHAVAPVLSFIIYSRDSWGRQRVEGFGELAIPPSSGHHDLNIPMSKPILSVREELEEFFLGTGEHEDKVRQFSTSDTTSHNVNSRLGMQLQSTGALLRVRLNIVEQTPQERPVEPLNQRRTGDSTAFHSIHHHAAPGSGLRVVKRSVHEILQSVKLEQRLSQPRDPSLQAALGSMTTGGASAVSAILERLKTRDQTSTSSI